MQVGDTSPLPQELLGMKRKGRREEEEVGRLEEGEGR